MPNFTKFRQKDVDGRWFEFDHQQMGNSCGPASAKIVKGLYHNTVVGEEALRGVGTLATFGAVNQGHSVLAQNVKDAKNWEISPTNKNVALTILKAPPAAIPGARQVTDNYVDHLRKSTRNRPTLIGWKWTVGGGHFNVCVGPTKADPSLVVILDPALGVQYMSLDDRVGKMLVYRPAGTNLEGRFTAKDFEPFIITH